MLIYTPVSRCLSSPVVETRSTLSPQDRSAYRFTQHSRSWRYIDLTPNPNPPPPMVLDINPADGYVLIGRGELAKVDETFLPAPPSEIETSKWEKPARFSSRRPLQPRRCSISKSQKYRLGSISPTVRPSFSRPDWTSR